MILYSDSKYLVNCFHLGWYNSQGNPVKNQDLWGKLLVLNAKHKITFKWIKAHNDNLLNERADCLSKQGRAGDLLVDVEYDRRT